MFCPKCGKGNPDEARFCMKCGSPLGSTGIPPNEGSIQSQSIGPGRTSKKSANIQQSASPNRSKGPIAAGITIAAVAIVVICIAVFIGQSSKPSSVLDKLETAYNNKDMYGILECFDPKVSQFAKGAASLIGGVFGVSGMSDMLPFASELMGSFADDNDWGTVKLTELSTNITGDTAIMRYNVSLIYPNGSKNNFDDVMRLIKVDGKWYISIDQSNL